MQICDHCGFERGGEICSKYCDDWDRLTVIEKIEFWTGESEE
jgi:Fe-S-cluster-containing hydrogenase component 2